jgi:hypothetical protein
MDDPYPSHFEIEIDRAGLRKYLRTKWLLSWAIGLGLLGAFGGLASAGKAFDEGLKPWTELLAIAARNMAVGLCTGLVLAAGLYLVCSHWLAALYANSLGMSVEGPFLRIRENWGARTDRRLHFRAIVDYAIQQGSLMRLFAVESLVMTTTGLGPTSTITIPGVKGSLATRDMLSEVDRLRENAP